MVPEEKPPPQPWLAPKMVVEEITEGFHLPILHQNQDKKNKWPLAKIFSMKDISGWKLFYVYYIDFNKHLDEWVTHDLLDLKKIQFPKKEAKTQDPRPTKNGLPGFRPSSPDHDVRKTLDLSLQPAATPSRGKTLPIPVQITFRFKLERQSVGTHQIISLDMMSCLHHQVMSSDIIIKLQT